jgi:3-hydroxyacyl-[acyl-carrier-protein] dehydratase
MKKFSLNLKEIEEYQQNRDPYLFLDYVTEVVPGVSSKGYKDLKNDEWFFKVHWPKDPNMPGMLQVESIVQTCALSILTLPGNKGKVVYLVSANNLKFTKKILPNNRIYMETKVLNFKRGLATCEGVIIMNNEIVCKAEFNLILPDEIKKYNLKNKGVI